MGGWFKVDKDMVSDPRLTDAAESFVAALVIAHRTPFGGEDFSEIELLQFGRNALLGALITLWEYADTHIRDDDTLPLSSNALDAIVGLEGFCDAIPDDWLVKYDDGTVELPGYCAKNALIAKEKRRSDNQRRQTAFRARKNAKSNVVHNATVTRDVTRDQPVTKRVDLDLYQDQDLKKGKEGEAPRKREATGTRLPDDWPLTPERADRAVVEGLDPQRTFTKFKNYWLSKSGEGATKKNWDKVWHNWCLNEPKPRQANGHAKPALDLTAPPEENDPYAPKRL